MIIAHCNQKGGVGKSISVFHNGRAAVRAGLRTLVVDADPQGNITSSMTAEPVAEDQAGLADALSARAPETIRDVIVEGIWPGLDVVPTPLYDALAHVRDELVLAGAGREGRLRGALAEVADDYDVILIDCGPSLDQLTINALTAADGALIVTQPSRWSLNGMQQLLGTIDSVRAYYNPKLVVAGVMPNLYDARLVSAAAWYRDLRAAMTERGLPLLTPPIPKAVVISEAADAARGLDEWGTTKAKDLCRLYDSHFAAIYGGKKP